MNKKTERINVGYFIKPAEYVMGELNFPLGMGFLENDREFIIDRISFPGYLIMSCLEGKLWVEQYGVKTQLLPGESCLLNLQDQHKYYYDEEDPCKIVWLHFDGKHVSELCSLIFDNTKKYIVIQEKHMPILIKNCIDIYRKEGMDSYLEISENIYKSLMIFLEQKKQLESKPQMILEKELNVFLDDHIGENITLEMMAEVCHLNPSYFCRRFKKEMNMTPMQYLLEKRIETAKFFLIYTNDKIATISKNLGFYDQNHFSFSFKKATGMSPTTYRKKKMSHNLL